MHRAAVVCRIIACKSTRALHHGNAGARGACHFPMRSGLSIGQEKARGMEKLFYALWQPADAAQAAWCEALRAIPAALASHGATQARVGVPDVALPDADPYPAMRAGAPHGFVSFWVQSAYARAAIEDCLRPLGARIAGYSVAESTILPAAGAAAGGREEGFLQVCGFCAPAGLSRAAFLDGWLNHHTAVAVETQDTRYYAQNVVVRPLTAHARAGDAIVDERFPAAALNDPAVYFDAVGAPARLAENQARMAESCARFIDFATIKLMN